ncbi:MAG: HPr(Ser) kinase/phosphatase [Lachnospiraceae bacterium]|nr:HPr(Ser) kinase/phosphatase [Pseudobutyrivibrio sp.]MEE0106061.1 HPr(Ser) kinase/phosphatase [Lachnospiraceae bacterium]
MGPIQAKLSVVADKLHLKNFTEELNLEEHFVSMADVNRPALQLNGFYEHFEENRIQMIGMVEYAYMNNKPVEERAKIYQKLLSYDIPCLIFCRGFVPEQSLMDVAHERKIPILGTDRGTSEFMSELIFELNVLLAPCATIHGVLVDVYGEGLLITGESGIGKSEAALELVRRGHRLVADDVVEIRKTNAHTLMGCAPTITKHFIELRGIGIIDVKSLFGVESIKERQRIDFVIKLEDWKKENDYDRLGLEDEYMNILGIDVTCHSLPIRPGRNLAVICETAAVNYRQKKMGYNAAQELYRRVQNNISHGQSE